MQAVTLLTACLLVGCSNNAAPPDSGSPPTGYGDGCPSVTPADQTPCKKDAAECEYSGQQAFCTQVFLCSGGQFSAEVGYCGTPDITGNLCAAKLSGVPIGKTCPSVVQCDYKDGRCSCAGPFDAGLDAALTWSCTQTPGNCPGTRPFLGMNCAPEGKLCDYGACFVEDTTFASPLALKCTGGVWVRAGCN